MIVRTVEDLKTLGSYREKPGVWSSARYLLRRDAMGFTLTQTTVAAGASQTMQYKNHVEANLIIKGRGRSHRSRHRNGLSVDAGHHVRPRRARSPSHRRDHGHADRVRLLSGAGRSGDA